MRYLILLGLLTFAPGCKPHPKAAIATPPVAKATTDPDTIVTKGALPAGWPDDLAVYPGAEIVEGRSCHTNGMPLLVAILHTKDAPDKVTEFHGQQASQLEFAVVSTSTVSGESVSLYRRGSQSLSVTTHQLKGTTATTEVELTLVGTYEASSATPPPPSSSSGHHNDPPKAPPHEAPSNPLLPRYPGATLVPSAAGGGDLLKMRTTETPEAVRSYYEQFYAGQGFATNGPGEFNGQVTETFTSTKATVFLNLVQARDDKGQQTVITLALKRSAP